MSLKPESEIRQALQDSQVYLETVKPEIPKNRKHVPVSVLEKLWTALAVINEISTLKWSLGKDQLSCYDFLSSSTKTAAEVEKALQDTRTFFKSTYPDRDVDKLVIDTTKDVAIFKIAGEVCTLNWLLGDGVLNCYGTD